MNSIIELLKEYQLNIMFALSLICGMLAFFVFITKTIIPGRKYIILSLELCAMFLLISERMSYHYRGDTRQIGYYMRNAVFFSPMRSLKNFLEIAM